MYLRNHVHVLGELAQEGGEGGRLLHDDVLLHSLHRGGWKADASSPGGGGGRGGGDRKLETLVIT